MLDRARKLIQWNRQSEEWCTAAKVHLTQLKNVWAKKPVPREAFQSICYAVGVDWREVVDYKASSPDAFEPIESWEGVPDVPIFHGRTNNLKNLDDGIVKDKSRVVVIHGIGGIGKTALAVQVTKNIRHQFDYVIWYSLASGSPLEEFLTDIFNFLKCHSNFDFPNNITNINDRISLLIRFCKDYRCLFILDGWETLLSSGEYAGFYQSQHIIYGGLMQRLGKEHHKSCFIVTTRDLPREIATLVQETGRFVRTHELEGLGEDARGIFQEQELLHEGLWSKLSTNYRGIPLLLKIVSPIISEMFGGSVRAFLQAGTLVTSDIANCLEPQFNRLSKLERDILYVLAEQNTPVSFDQLREISIISKNELFTTLESLVRRRSLVEKTTSSSGRPDGFTLAPVIREYVLNRPRVTSQTQ